MSEPISLDLAKQHLRLLPDPSDDDDLVDEAIADARGWVENYTGQKLVAEDVVEKIDWFAGDLLTWPIVSVDAVTYLDRAGNEQTLDPAAYRLLNEIRPARLVPVPGKGWPATLGEQSVSVAMTAGYESADEIPRGMRRAMLLLITGYYDNRDTGGLDDATEAAAKAACGPKSRAWRV